MKRLKGVVCATITPMDENGRPDVNSFINLVEHLAKAGINGIYPNGTNGESLSLLEDERMMMAEAAVRADRGNMAVYIQCGASTEAETRRHVLHAKKIGADGAGIMTPVFFACDEKALEEYYDGLLSAEKDFPMYLYNIPSRAGNDITPALFHRLMEKHDNLMGIKFSAPNLLRIQEYLIGAPREADVLIGCDRLAACCVTEGGAGWVSGPAAVFADRFSALYDAIKKEDKASAFRIQREITQTCIDMDGIPEIPAIKYMLKKQGIIQNDTCRMPLRKLTDIEKIKLEILI